MCLIVLAWKVIPGMPLIAASNRDESYDRPASPAEWWEGAPQVYAGRDLRADGTWQGITKSGKFAAITNIRAPGERRADAPSRGSLVADYLRGDLTAAEYVAQLASFEDDYNGFNLLVGDCDTLIWYSNRAGHDARNGQPLTPGLYGLSNGLLDTPWPKVTRTKAHFASLLCQGAPDDAFFEMLTDTTRATDCRLPKTGVDLELERVLSAVCIESPTYGTRVSTLTQLYRPEMVRMQERLVR
jgi:uncharacterized protein with NRDE domain